MSSSGSGWNQGPQLVGLDQISSLCTTDHGPIILTGIIKRLLISHFSSEDNIEHDQIKNYVWTEDVTTTNIVIEPVFRWNAKNVQQRPAVMIKRNSMRLQKIAINHGWSNHRDGIERHHALCIGSHTAFCIAASGGEAEVIAYEVFKDLLEFGPVIQKDMKLHRFMPTGIEPVALLEESKQHFVAPVPVAWAYSDSWLLRPEAPFLKGLTIDFEPTD